MSERILVNPESPPTRVPARVWNEMRSHALETGPEECCGLLVGTRTERFREVHRCRNDMTRLHRQDPTRYPRDGRAGFHISEGDMARVLAHAEASDQRVTGVYHSHVDAGAWFSEVDVAFAREPTYPFPGAEHFVLSVVDARVREMAAFRWDEASATFAGRPVVPEVA